MTRMQRGQNQLIVPLAIAVVLAVAACENPPASPSASGPPSTTSATGLAVTGPTRVVPGATAQYTASLQMADGRTTDVTEWATFSSYDSPIILASEGRGDDAGRPREEVLDVGAERSG